MSQGAYRRVCGAATPKGAARRGCSATGPASVAEIYLSGGVALWAALMSGAGNTPRIRTARDAAVSTATEAGGIRPPTAKPGAPPPPPGAPQDTALTTRREE